MNPPKCRSCGKIEWQHICKGPAAPLALRGRASKPPKVAKPKPKKAKSA